MVRELLGFAGLVGHAELVFMCDNEPTLRQLQRMAVNARLSLGLATRATTPPPYMETAWLRMQLAESGHLQGR